MSGQYSGGNTDENVDITPSTQPSRRTRSQVLSSPEIPPVTYGHFPPAPHTYPIPPLVDVPAQQSTSPDVSGHPLNGVASNSSLTPPEPTSNTSGLPKRPNSGSIQPPAAKRAKKPGKKATQHPAGESLQGIGPIPPQLSPSEDQPSQLSQVGPQPQQPRTVTASPWWAYVYSLDSDKEPAIHSIPDGPILSENPGSTHIGCLACTKSREWKAWKNNGGVLSNIKRHHEQKHREIIPVDDAAQSSHTTMHSSIPCDVEKLVDAMVTWIIADDHALRVVDSKYFRAMIMAANPALADKDIPHRTNINKRVLQRFKEDRVGLREKLKNSLGRISLTSDLWSDSNLTSFMAVTLHWVALNEDNTLELKTALGGFRWVKDKHSGENIASRFVEILAELDILDKIGGITMDNASNNDTAMESFGKHLKERGIDYNPQQQRIRCFAHVLNLSVQDALTALASPDAFDLRHLRDGDLKTKWREGQQDTNYSDALKSDLIGRVQAIVRQLRSSGQRRDALQQAIITGNQAGLFPKRLKSLQLLRHVDTRWSSTYYMLNRFIYLTPAINLLLNAPNVTTLTRDDTLNVRDTSVLDDIHGFLSFFNSVQETLACEKTPTLPYVLPVYEQLFALLKDLCHEYPKLMHAVYASLKKLDKYRTECQLSDLYMLAMVLNPSFKFECLSFTCQWEAARVEEARKATLSAMSLHSKPPKAQPAPIRTPLTSYGLSERNLNHNLNSLSALAAKLKHRSTTPQPESRAASEPPSHEEEKRMAEEATKKEIEEELREYENEGLMRAETDLSLHTILSYWKASSHKFPRLFKLAMTILAIPATSVPSERVFSSSGRTDTAARNRLSPLLMEALQILKFNGRNNVLDFRSAISDDIEDLQEVVPEEQAEDELYDAAGIAYDGL